MNPYFLFFSTYAALILPLTLRFRIRLGRRSGYLFRIQAVGLPFVRKRKPNDTEDERPIEEKEVALNVANTDYALLRALLDGGVRRRLKRALRLEELRLDARVDCKNAYHTAMLFVSAETLLRTLHLTGALPSVFVAKLGMAFDGDGSEMLFQGIVTLRLGSLLPAAALFTAVYLRTRARLATTEEDAYAATSH